MRLNHQAPSGTIVLSVTKYKQKPMMNIQRMMATMQGGAIKDYLQGATLAAGSMLNFLAKGTKKAITETFTSPTNAYLGYTVTSSLLDQAKRLFQTHQGDIPQELSLFINSVENGPNKEQKIQVLNNLIKLAQKYLPLNNTPLQAPYNTILHYTVINSVANLDAAPGLIRQADKDLKELTEIDPSSWKGWMRSHANRFYYAYGPSEYYKKQPTLQERSSILQAPSAILAALPAVQSVQALNSQPSDVIQYKSLPHQYYVNKLPQKRKRRYYRRR